ncbi:MAG TPA: ATP-binding protein, partial [Thermodesulfobacteriota bacterium]|nr:ATP-binding protein [Thermodesulfobacteriota bacterium]
RCRPFNQRREVEKNLAFTSRIDPDLPVIQGDAFRLEQMLINLIDNAIKYTEKGSITLSLSRKEDRVEIVVEDTGIGIPSEHLSRIFERFYVVDKSRSRKAGGTGLGLSIVKHIVLLHKGTIRVDSIAGVGTTFIISLPINPATC